MDYGDFVASIQEAAKEHLTGGNILFMVLLFIAIIVAIVTFAMYVRKEYYRKRSEIDTFMYEDKHKTDIYVPEISDKKPKKKERLVERIFNYLNKE